MYKEHPSFEQPYNESLKLWRYMDFTKFVSLLENKSLFFNRADKFDDPFEGSTTRLNVAARDELNLKYDLQDDTSGAALKEMRKYIAINCWHENEYESAAMWKLYLQSNEGIAIMTSWKSLKSSIIGEEDVHIGKVKYINYDTDGIDVRNFYNSYLHKRHSFEHEKEIRALVMKFPISDVIDERIPFEIETMDYGLNIDVCIETLIHRVYVAPSAPEWFFELTKSMIKKYDYEFEVIKSNIYSSPIF